MGEYFQCGDKHIYFSNSACHELQMAWSRIAGDFDSEHMKALSKEFYEGSWVPGASATGIDDHLLPKELREREMKQDWLKIMEILIEDIDSSGSHSARMDVNWDRKLRDDWLERLREMRDYLKRNMNTQPGVPGNVG